MELIECKICNEQFYNRCFLKKHLKKKHCLTYKDYVITYQYDGKHPQCACGCGQFVTWHNDACFKTLCKGHYTQEMREVCRTKRLGKTLSQETKDKISSNSLQFFASNEGKQLKKERANNLKAFYASDDGKKLCLVRSQQLKEYNASEEGKLKRKIVGEKLHQLQLNDPHCNDSRSKKLLEYYSSDKGKQFLSDRSINLQEYYELPHTKERLLNQAKLAAEKTKLSIEQFNDKVTQLYEIYSKISNEEVLQYDNYISVRESFYIDVELTCKTCNKVSKRSFNNVFYNPQCVCCNKSQSSQHLEINKFLSDLGFVTKINDRKIIGPLELDIFIPDQQFAIEYNGLYWHSNLNRKNDHVVHKCLLAQTKNINLMTIYEDQWLLKQQLVKRMIKQNLNFDIKDFDLQNVIIKYDVDFDQIKTFIDHNTFQDVNLLANNCVLVDQQTNQILCVMFYEVIDNLCKLYFVPNVDYQIAKLFDLSFSMIQGVCCCEQYIIVFDENHVYQNKFLLEQGFNLNKKYQQKWYTDFRIRSKTIVDENNDIEIYGNFDLEFIKICVINR